MVLCGRNNTLLDISFSLMKIGESQFVFIDGGGGGGFEL